MHPGKAMAPRPSTLAWKIPWMEGPGGPQSMGSLRVGHNWVTSLSLFTFMHWRKKGCSCLATHSSVLAWRVPGTGEPGGLPSMRSHRVRHDWRDLAAATAAICASVSKMYPKVYASLLYSTSAYERFHKNILLSESGENLCRICITIL